MNPRSADQALDFAINADRGCMQQFYEDQTKPPDLGRSNSGIELMSMINTANKRSRMITAPPIKTGRMGSTLAAETKSERQMRRVAVSHFNSNVSATGNTSALHKFSSAFPSGQQAAVAAGSLSRAVVAAKVKNKRESRSQRVPTTVVRTDTSNFKAMVQHFTGIPTTTNRIEESALATCASYFLESTTSPSSTLFSIPLPHPAVCKRANSSSTAAPTCASPLPPSYFPTCQSLSQLPFTSATAGITATDRIPTSAHSKEQTMPLAEEAFFQKLWS